jgi:tetratricopeptide (TPR) repeat protein
LLRRDHLSVLQFALVGFVAGLAILTKTTAILLLPPLLLLGALKRDAASQSFAVPLRNIAAMLAVCFAVSGWYYVWIWHRFGRPVVGNWEYDVGFHWWQDPGYHSVLDYLRFGCALDRPFFSSLSGFADGIYSTLWGDALLSGTSSVDLRVPWNYNLMTAGYLLALIPSAIILIGLGAALRDTRSARSVSWLVLLSFCGAVGVGFLFITLRVPSYAQVKAFYGMALLVPLCCFAAMGWDALARRPGTLRLVLGASLLIFAFNSYAWAWIRPSAAQHVYAGIRLFLEKNSDAAMTEAQRAIDSPTETANTRRVLALLLSELKHPVEALEQAKSAVELEPLDGATQLQLAMVLAGRGDLEEAVQLARAAVQLGPENWMAWQELATWSLQARFVDEAFSAAKDGLAVAPFNPELHYTLALAAATKRDFATAANHFGYAVMIRKEWTQAATGLRQSIFAMVEAPDASRQLDEIVRAVPDSPPELDGLAWILATHPDAALRNGKEAIRLARRGCEITNFQDPTLLATLAAAYAEVGLFSQATSTVERALNLSRISANAEVAGLSEQLLESFRQNHPYRNAPIPP